MFKAFLQRKNTLPIYMVGVMLLCAFFVAFLLPNTTSNAQVRTADEGDASPTPTATPTPSCSPSIMVPSASSVTCPQIIVKSGPSGKAVICVNDTETVTVLFDQIPGSAGLGDCNHCSNSPYPPMQLKYALNTTWILTESNTSGGTGTQVATGSGTSMTYSPTTPGYYNVTFTCTGNTLTGDTCDGNGFTCAPAPVPAPFSFVAYQVGLTPVAVDDTDTVLQPGVICLNAQDVYKSAKWKASVKPDGTATATVKSGGVQITGDATKLHDGDTFQVQGTSNGNYTLTIKHNIAGCPVDGAQKVAFAFFNQDISLTANPTSKNDGYGQVIYQKIDGSDFNLTIGDIVHAYDLNVRQNSQACTVTYKFKIITVPDGAYSSQVHAKTYFDCDINGDLDTLGAGTIKSTLTYSGTLSVSGMYDPPQNDVTTPGWQSNSPIALLLPAMESSMNDFIAKNYIDDSVLVVGSTVSVTYTSTMTGTTTQVGGASFNGSVTVDGFDDQIYGYHLENAQ